MNVLLLFFALPIATIIIAIILEQLIRCPLKVALLIFAIFLIVTFAVFDVSFLVFAIAYTILAYIAAVLTRLICNIIYEDYDDNCCNCNCSKIRRCGCGCNSNGRNRRGRCVYLPECNEVLANAIESAINTVLLDSGNNNNANNNPIVINTNGTNSNNEINNSCRCGCRRR